MTGDTGEADYFSGIGDTDDIWDIGYIDYVWDIGDANDIWDISYIGNIVDTGDIVFCDINTITVTGMLGMG